MDIIQPDWQESLKEKQSISLLINGIEYGFELYKIEIAQINMYITKYIVSNMYCIPNTDPLYRKTGENKISWTLSFVD